MGRSPLNPQEMLRAKAMLLLRRERDLYELQREWGRSEAWLGAFHRLSHDLRTATFGALLDAWTSLIVDTLGFQISGIYGLSASESELELLTGQAHVPLKQSIALQASTFDYLTQHPSGRYSHGAPSELAGFAEQLQLETFLWYWQGSRSQQLLLMAGFALLPGRAHRFGEHDLEHFCLFGAHLRALLDNVALIRELDHERAVLRDSNQHLDDSLKELQEAQLSLVQQRTVMLQVSRRAGMADVATGVLHNVGNVLNSINVSVQVTSERLTALRTKGLTRVIELLERNLPGASSADTTHKIVDYLRQLTGYLEEQKSLLVQEVSSMQHHIDHVKRVIGKQQDYAQAIGVFEQCELAHIVDDAFSLASDSLKRYGIKVVRRYETITSLRVDRHKVLQILINLVSNAIYAVRTSHTNDRLILAQVDTVSRDRMRVTIQDNGVGISAVHLPRLFTHGFTTKESGHGFGLHTSAIAAKELGGELRGASDGTNLGATFELELPTVPVRGLEV